MAVGNFGEWNMDIDSNITEEEKILRILEGRIYRIIGLQYLLTGPEIVVLKEWVTLDDYYSLSSSYRKKGFIYVERYIDGGWWYVKGMGEFIK